MAKTNEPEKRVEQTKEMTLCEHIKQISKASQKLLRSGLNKQAVIVLLYSACSCDSMGRKPSKEALGDILESLADLEKTYCQK